jgi:outer membrane protein insertion porin family
LSSIRLFALCVVAVLALQFPLPTDAQNMTQTSSVIKNIVVQGMQRIEQGTIRSYLLLQEGDSFDRRRVDQSLKSLFATGLFADVVVSMSGNSLIVKVVENPVINRIAFEGNKRITNENLKTEVVLRPRVVFTRTKVQADVKRILEIYRVNGRFSTSVVPKIIQLPQNRADLVFEINEGPLTKVKRISFVGNRVESDSDLRSVIRTKESLWYNFFSSDDTYDPDRITLDRELLRRHYLAEGYADFSVDSAIGELTPDGKAFFITFSVSEGERYKFGNIDVSANLRGVNTKELFTLINFQKGDQYDNTKIDKAVDKITDAVGNRGFAFVEVKPKINSNRKEKVINLTFRVSEGPRVFIERINITGNMRTIDKVIRREFQLAEGDAFNAAKFRRSRQRIQSLNFFNKVNVQRLPGSSPDKTIVKVEVEEKSTGALSFGFGYSTENGPLIDVGVRESNLLGKGQVLSLNGTLAGEKSTLSLSFTEPYFLDRDIAAGYDLYHVNQDNQAASSSDLVKTGLGLRAGFLLSQDLRQRWGYRIEAASIENVGASASSLIKSQEGDRYLSEVSHTLTYDRRDSRISPSEGYRVSVTNNLAGLAGNVRYLRNKIDGVKYYQVYDKVIFGIKGHVGHIFGLDKDVEFSDRFSLGGSNLRGFLKNGVGPRDITTDDSLGGEWIYAGSLQLSFPLGLPSEFGISGRIFSDYGSMGSVNPSNSNIRDSGSLRGSAGAGLGWVSPMGPINLDLSYVLMKEDYDKEELLRVNFGTRF